MGVGIRTVLIVLAMAFVREGYGISRVTLGGYVPFASSVQEKGDGELNTFSFAPTVSVGTSVPLEELKSEFSPELGLVFHRSGAGGDYDKSTLYILGDLEMEWVPSWRLRYGLGLFATLIDGEGGIVSRNNGEEEVDFRRPGKSHITYNLAFDFGWDYSISRRWFLRLETFIFSIWNEQARDMGYLLVLGYRPSL